MVVDFPIPHLRAWVRLTGAALWAEVPGLGPDHFGSIFHLTAVMDEHLWAVIRQESSRMDGSGFLKPDLRVGQEQGLVLAHTVIRQPAFWSQPCGGL